MLIVERSDVDNLLSDGQEYRIDEAQVARLFDALCTFCNYILLRAHTHAQFSAASIEQRNRSRQHSSRTTTTTSAPEDENELGGEGVLHLL
jgi:hypothetical protein